MLTAAIAVLGLTGCSVNSPTTTLLRYAPADGVEIDGAAVEVRDLLVVSHGDGAPGVVLGTVVNQTSEPVTVTVSAAGTDLSPQVEVGPGSSARLDAFGVEDAEPVTIPSLDSPAGQSVEIRVTTDSETLAANAPVLLPRDQYAEYADLAGGPVEDDAADD